MKRSLLLLTFITLTSLINASGPTSLDTSFNDTGYLITEFVRSTITYSRAIALQEDGKIIVAGFLDPYGFIARYNSDGSLDITFNASDTPGHILSTTMIPNALAIQPNGNIVVTGQPFDSTTIMARYLSDGTIDTSFGTSGYVTTSIMTVSNSVALQSDGKIIVGGANNSAAVIMRYTTNGALDTTTFAEPNGYVTFAIGTGLYARSVQLQDDGDIVVAGYTTISSITNVFVTRYTTSGTIDTSFNNSTGYFITDFGTQSTSFANICQLAIQNNQQIIVAGEDNNQRFIMRLQTDGTLDTSSFASPTGYVLGALESAYTSVALQTNQQAVACGYTNASDIVITRYTTDGTIDDSCNFTFSPSITGGTPYGIAIQTDEKLITTGNGSNQLLIIRILGGFTPTIPTIASTNIYGYDSTWLSEFLYVDAYAQIITDTTAQAATIAATNEIIASFVAAYINQPSFNFISYAYLMNEDLTTAQTLLTDTYPDSYSEIIQFFEYIFERENQLLS